MALKYLQPIAQKSNENSLPGTQHNATSSGSGISLLLLPVGSPPARRKTLVVYWPLPTPGAPSTATSKTQYTTLILHCKYFLTTIFHRAAKPDRKRSFYRPSHKPFFPKSVYGQPAYSFFVPGATLTNFYSARQKTKNTLYAYWLSAINTATSTQKSPGHWLHTAPVFDNTHFRLKCC